MPEVPAPGGRVEDEDWDGRDLGAVVGWTEGRMVTVILALEREAKVVARPVPAWERAHSGDADVCVTRVRLRGDAARDPADVVRSALHEALEAWKDRPAGARVDVG